jgi:predicted Zn-dependent peptidase
MHVDAYTTSEVHEKRVLANGVRVLAQHVPATYSVVLGVFVGVGSRDEARYEAGISHFVEHMVFKGTERRSAYDLALALERVGGSLEAHTTKEYTCFYTRVLREHFDLALDVLADLVQNSTFLTDQISLEHGVVIEEINNVYDNPEDWIFEILAEKVYGAHPMAFPILGSRETVSAIGHDELRGFMRRAYVGSNVVIAVAGDIEVESALVKIEAAFPFAPGSLEHQRAPMQPTVAGAYWQQDDKLTQQYITLGCTSLSYETEDRFPLLLTTTWLGGGMSSRLFQSVRERTGLCYSIYTFAEFTRDGGLTGTFLAVSPENTAAALDLVWNEFETLGRGGISAQELHDNRDQLKGSMLLGMENVASRMSRLAKNEMTYGRQVEVPEVLRRLDAITQDDVMRMLDAYFRRDGCFLVGLGPRSSL